MTNDVFFRSAEDVGPKTNQLEQIKELFQKISPVRQGDIVAVKIHPGEYGNTTYIRPVLVRTVVDLVRDAGGIPFVTDTTTLYKGMKLNAAELIWAAAMNGFTQASMNAPFIVADGLLGDDAVSVDIGGSVLKDITVASAIAKADSMVVLSHAKGHPGSGFGGAIKNLGMGCLDKEGKTRVHEVGRPTIDPEKCVACGDCIDICAWDALVLEDTYARVDHELCRGELACMASCPQEAIIAPDDVDVEMQKMLGEAALGPIKCLSGRIGYINWIYDLTPGCDCFNFSAPQFAENVGITASTDPVAIDAATVDLINGKMGHHGRSIIDVWGVDPIVHLRYAEQIGCGKMEYSLLK
ncbi:MAG: DUF362 domain-containing protein [ANME-2 cluster archaeon]|jgi:uncharacterized Fe-S center protein|nr:DUF362 domain-containing protein [ANME-2 cluster archaeon]